jgi:predicted dehydrogenase
MEKVRWGVLGCAKIAIEKVIPALQQCENGVVSAIASRNIDNAKKAAESLGIATAHGSYEALLDDPDVDAIYNPLPNHLHVPWSQKTIEAGKHVLCEKPIGLSVAEAEALQKTASQHPQVKVMEAFMYRFHPQWQKAYELVESGAIGELRAIQTFFSYYNVDPANVRHAPEMGGGGLMDIGCYPISQARYLFKREPERIFATMDIDSRFSVDRDVSAIMDFGSATASFTCSMQMQPFQRTNIVGTEGRIEIEIPVNTLAYVAAKMTLTTNDNSELIVLPVCDQYTLQGSAFADAILSETDVPTPLSDAVNNMKVIEAAVQSHEQGQWVSLK